MVHTATAVLPAQKLLCLLRMTPVLFPNAVFD
jgi:hypothetical protein